MEWLSRLPRTRAQQDRFRWVLSLYQEWSEDKWSFFSKLDTNREDFKTKFVYSIFEMNLTLWLDLATWISNLSFRSTWLAGNCIRNVLAKPHGCVSLVTFDTDLTFIVSYVFVIVAILFIQNSNKTKLAQFSSGRIPNSAIIQSLMPGTIESHEVCGE